MSVSPTPRQGDWLQTYTGRQFWPMDPRPDEIHIEDVAHSLAMQCRYAGHCQRFYSVAEHSVLLARWVSRETFDNGLALWALLHDASEAYLVDVPRPVKPFLRGYDVAEARVMLAVCERFGLPLAMPEIVHDADSRILVDEKNRNMVSGLMWGTDGLEPLSVDLEFWSPARAEEAFLSTFKFYSEETANAA